MVVDYYSGDNYVRENVVEPLISGVRMFGINVFDECREIVEEGGEHLLRETDYYAMTNVLSKHRYMVIVVTKELLGDISVLVELEIISKLFETGRIKVFTVLCNIGQEDLPDRVKWLKNTYVLEVKTAGDIRWACIVIAERYWYDRAKASNIVVDWDNPDICAYLKNSYVGNDAFIKELLDVYSRLDRHNYSRCMVVLMLLNRYLCVKYPVLKFSKENQQCIKQLSEAAYSARALGKREMNTLACCVVDMLERVR